jgi:hypothetical protein
MQIDHKANYPDKNHFRQQIMRARREGLANLRQAHPTDQQYRRVSLRISALCALSLEHLRLLDETYREFDDFLNEPRGPHHQQWASDRAGHYLKQVELAIDDAVTAGIRHIGSELSNPPREVIREVVIPPSLTWYQQIKVDWGRLPGWLRFSVLASLVVAAIIVLAR